MQCAHLSNGRFAEEQSVVEPNKKGLWVQRDQDASLNRLFYQLYDPGQ